MSNQPKSGASIPKGVEVLVKKAAVDETFKKSLLANRLEAAEAIGLELSPAERMLLEAIPETQFEMTIDRTTVPAEHHSAFLGKVAAVMLAVCTMGGPGSVAHAEDKPATTKEDAATDDTIDVKKLEKELAMVMKSISVKERANQPLTKGSRPDKPSRFLTKLETSEQVASAKAVLKKHETVKGAKELLSKLDALEKQHKIREATKAIEDGKIDSVIRTLGIQPDRPKKK